MLLGKEEDCCHDDFWARFGRIAANATREGRQIIDWPTEPQKVQQHRFTISAITARTQPEMTSIRPLPIAGRCAKIWEGGTKRIWALQDTFPVAEG
jgi:hypothetical protein